ncbi:putative membrane protein [Clostridioides difficile CD160]|nr:putative membrane protein [Clostridioides difficile CD160]
MSRSELGVKANLVSELLMLSYFFIDLLLEKFIFKGEGIWITFIILLVFWVFDSMYNKKYNDLVDEASKLMLLKVDQIASKIMLYSIFVIAVLFSANHARALDISNLDIGIILLAVLFIQSLSKLILYIYFDKRGICN